MTVKKKHVPCEVILRAQGHALDPFHDPGPWARILLPEAFELKLAFLNCPR